MSTSQVLAWLEDAHEDLARVLAPDDGVTAVARASHRMHDCRPALPGTADGDRVSGTMVPGAPPGFAQKDAGQEDRLELHKLALRVRRDMDGIVRLVQAWSARQPTPKDRELTSLNQKEDPGCEHCRTIGKWASVRQGAGATRCNGNLEEPMSLCAFCYRFCLDTGALPTRKQLEDHHNGVRVKRPA